MLSLLGTHSPSLILMAVLNKKASDEQSYSEDGIDATSSDAGNCKD